MSSQGNRDGRRVWSADEIQEQLDEVAEVLVQGAGEFVKGLFFGAPARKPKAAKAEGKKS